MSDELRRQGYSGALERQCLPDGMHCQPTQQERLGKVDTGITQLQQLQQKEQRRQENLKRSALWARLGALLGNAPGSRQRNKEFCDSLPALDHQQRLAAVAQQYGSSGLALVQPVLQQIAYEESINSPGATEATGTQP